MAASHTVRIAGIQSNPIVGDLYGNYDRIIEHTRTAYHNGAQVAIFGELSLIGYPIEDLALRHALVTECLEATHSLARELANQGLGEMVVLVGHLDHDDFGPKNAASVLHNGAIVTTYDKYWLPNYGVFDEKRWFHPGHKLPLLTIGGQRFGLVICEDIWQPGGPVSAYASLGLDGLFCLNASPFHEYQPKIRHDIIIARSQEINAPLYYVNIVGGQDELVFDGNSHIVLAQDTEVTVLAQASQFQEDIIYYDSEPAPETKKWVLPEAPWIISEYELAVNSNTKPPLVASPAEPLDRLPSIWEAIVLGTRDYIHKTGGQSVLIGLSGGIDSALVAAIAVDALGADNVYGIAMPSRYSSPGSLEDAQELARLTGLHYRVEPIEKMVEVYVEQLGLSGLAEENIQARCRGMLLMAISNKENHLVLATGNKSELSVGYSTLYGDAVGAYSPIRDIPKTLVFELAQWRNTRSEIIPTNSITKPPSAELRPDQKDTDSLPDYDLLDAILVRYIEHDKDPQEITRELQADSTEVTRVCKLVDRAEFKRRQYPLGPKITTKAFGKDRRVPIVNNWSRHW